MTDLGTYHDIGVSLDGYVATVEIRRPPHNFFDSDLIAQIGEALERIDASDSCRAIVLCAEGRSFCAGADFSKRWTPARSTKAAAAAPASISTRKPAHACSAPRSRSSGRIHGTPRSAAGSAFALRPGFPGDLCRGAVQRQFQPARLSPRFRPDLHAPAAAESGRAARAALLFCTRRAHPRATRRCAHWPSPICWCRKARRVRSAAQALALGDGAIGAAGGGLDPRDHAARARRRGRGGYGARTGRAGLAGAAPRISRKASRR